MNHLARLLLVASLVGWYQWPVIKDRSSSVHLGGYEPLLQSVVEGADNKLGKTPKAMRTHVENTKIAMQAHALQWLAGDAAKQTAQQDAPRSIPEVAAPLAQPVASTGTKNATAALHVVLPAQALPVGAPPPSAAASTAGLKTLPAADTAQLTDTTPTTLLLVGDSVMGEIAYGLKRWSAKNKAWLVVDAHKVSSGLSNQAYYDWPAVFAELVEQHKPRLVAMMVGANDPQDIFVDKKRLRFGSDEWAAAYTSRVNAILDTATKHDIQVYWVLPPIMREGTMERHVATIRETIRAALKARGHGVTVVDEWDRFVDKDGHYAETALANGKPRGLRAEDGVHLSAFGAQLYVEAVLKATVPPPKAEPVAPLEKAPVESASAATTNQDTP